MKSALTEESVLPTLHNLILAEVYLSGGPVDVFRLWSEMYERQKTINVGTLIFTRAVVHLEEQGFLEKVSEIKSAITRQGEAYLIALLLSESLSDEALVRLAESGLKLASTGNILDVAPQGEKGGEHENQILSPSSAEGLELGPVSQRGNGLSAKQILNRATKPVLGLDVADRRLANTRVDSPCVGDEGVSSNPKDVTEYRLSPTADSQILDRHGDDRFADNILRALEGLPQNGDAEEEEAAAEEGALIEASGYLDPVYEVPR